MNASKISQWHLKSSKAWFYKGSYASKNIFLYLKELFIFIIFCNTFCNDFWIGYAQCKNKISSCYQYSFISSSASFCGILNFSLSLNTVSCLVAPKYLLSSIVVLIAASFRFLHAYPFFLHKSPWSLHPTALFSRKKLSC